MDKGAMNEGLESPLPGPEPNLDKSKIFRTFNLC